MSDIEQYLPPAAPASQATAIEQSRAVAEVHAAVMVARQCPRDEAAAEARMRRACSRLALAEKAFFAFPRAGETVTGPTIHLARELALIWGNLQYSVVELSRDDIGRRSEVLAYAWDLESNSRSSQVFIAPHDRDTKKGRRELKELRDVYENNANQGARRVREAIFAVLPLWFREQAEELCRQTLQRGTGEPLAERIEKAVQAFSRGSVTLAQLEKKVGRPRERWDESDVVTLQTIFQSITRGDIKRDEAFPPEPVTAGQLLAEPATPAAESLPVAAPVHTHDDLSQFVADCPGCRDEQAEADRLAATS